MEAKQLKPPQSLSAKFEGSFAYLTVRDRLPLILTKVIDTLHRNKNNFFDEHGEAGIEAEKKAISFLSKLRNELQTDKPVLPLTDGAEDIEAWNQYMQRQQSLMEDEQPVSWFKSPWLYVECYMYRRIQEALWLSPRVGDFDVFKEGKTQSFFESQQATKSLCMYLREVLIGRNNPNKNPLLEQFLKFLQVSLWGNRCDLSISAGQDNSQKTSPIDTLADLQRFILVDDSADLWAVLMAAQASGGTEIRGATVDIILDNAGFELITDLVLADFIVSTGLAREVRFHGKSIPWFVSDVNKQDFNWTIMQTMASNHKETSACGVQWKRYMKEGVWSYHDHRFWTLPHAFWDMATEAPDLYSSLQSSNLVLLKGDLNYRKLTGDRDWEHTVPFGRALRGFQPAPLCSVRTLKANVQVGLQPGQGEKLTSQDPDWMTSGKYAVIQFFSPPKEQVCS
ncbi:damage-control phosphatase ARMT1 isoform X1 [Electrophorus electricus]|uniref:Sugar phosphate phosphatase n=1 Tax=Electrophorus electricus TaxID=8005 RepID=A0A4W4FVK5_ELEEL|nr:damage-control phosphatase ARMT1 isoform X1 [Electrophorus electricus]